MYPSVNEIHCVKPGTVQGFTPVAPTWYGSLQ